MQAKFVMAVLLSFVLITTSACSGGGNDTAKLTELEDRVTAAEEARKKAEEKAAEEERKRKEAEADAEKADDAETARKKAESEAEEEKKKRLAAEQRERQAKQEADQRIEEAERQANVAVRAPRLITEIGAEVSGDVGVDDAGTDMGVEHELGGSRTFIRPLNLPLKGSAPSVPGGWSSKSYSGPRGNVGTDTVYLYTNIQAPGSKAFWKEHGESVTSLTGAASDFDETATVSSFGTNRSLYQGSDGNPENRDNGSRSGTYDGYSGTFKCSTACNIAAAADGALTFAGTWTFTASLTAKRSSKQAEQDTEFLYFGVWAYEPAEPARDPDLKWAAGGDSNAGDAAIGNFTDLTGTATFTGGAIGKYALAKVGGREAKIGTFTATASFTADFDKAPDGTEGNRLSGRITDFKEGGTSVVSQRF